MKKIQASPLLFFFISIILLLLHTANSGNLNDSFTASAAACDGSVECLVGDELPVHPRVARMLYDLSSKSSVGRTPNPNQASVDCPVKKGYRTCLPSRNGGPPKQKCGDYTRNC